jgi:polyphosphate kinase
MQMTDSNAEPRFINREASLLEFNRRVLALAGRTDIPLLERLKFLCISSSNMDEFFEVRLAGILELTRNPIARTVPDMMHPGDAVRMLHEAAHHLVTEQYRVLNEQLIPALAEQGIHFLHRARWTTEQQAWLRDYFQDNLQPVLTPLGLDPSHPFPRVLNKALHFIVSLSGHDAFGGRVNMAVVRVPRSLPRIIELPVGLGEGKNFVFLSSILHAHVDDLFTGMTVTGCHQFRLTRNTNLFVDEEEVDDVATALEGELFHRNYGDPLRLEVSDLCPDGMVNYLLDKFGLDRMALYQVAGPVNLPRLSAVPGLVGRPDLEYPPYLPAPLPEGSTTSPGQLAQGEVRVDLFARVRQGDILLHHPYQSFAPVIDFLRQAAADPNVLAIRMTLYRTGENSAIIDALEHAARTGKEVTVIAEVRARFDEDNNIRQAARLHEASAHVVYGVVGLKTHAKMLLVVRREPDGLKRYVHLGTGNYHHITTRFYTDFGLLTANKAIGRDVARIFQQLTSLGTTEGLEVLLQSPFTLHSGIIERIEREAAHAAAGNPGRIIAKMNGLQEPKVIEALYAASAAGVEIDLIVRGICCLRAGVPGLSENIRVRSILGRFLEHHRVFYFGNNAEPELFLASADWMKRNLLGRVEIGFPIRDPELFERVYAEGLDIYLRDTGGAFQLESNGSYREVLPANGQEPFSAQAWLMQKYAP